MTVSEVNNYFMNPSNYAGQCAQSSFQKKMAKHKRIVREENLNLKKLQQGRNCCQRSVYILPSSPIIFKPRIFHPRPLTEDDLINCRPFRRGVKKIGSAPESFSHQSEKIRMIRSHGKKGQQVIYVHQPYPVIARAHQCFFVPPPPHLHAQPPPPPPCDQRTDKNNLESNIESVQLPPPPPPPYAEDMRLEKREINYSLISTSRSGKIFAPSSEESYKVAQIKIAKKQTQQMLPISEEDPEVLSNDVFLEKKALEALPKTPSPEFKPILPPPLPESSLFSLDDSLERLSNCGYSVELERLSNCSDSVGELERLSNCGDSKAVAVSPILKEETRKRISYLDEVILEGAIPPPPKYTPPPLPEAALPKDAEG